MAWDDPKNFATMYIKHEDAYFVLPIYDLDIKIHFYNTANWNSSNPRNKGFDIKFNPTKDNKKVVTAMNNHELRDKEGLEVYIMSEDGSFKISGCSIYNNIPLSKNGFGYCMINFNFDNIKEIKNNKFIPSWARMEYREAAIESLL